MGRTKQFLAKLLDLDTSSPSPNNTIDSNRDHDLIQKLESMQLKGPKSPTKPPPPKDITQFVGGFNPYQQAAPAPGLPGPLPRPPAMPVPYGPLSNPQSLTMHYAMAQTLPYDYSPSSLSVPTATYSHSAPNIPQSVSVSRVKLAPIQPPKRLRATSISSTPSDTNTQNQCSGVTKAGKRCTRRVKTGPALMGVMNNGAVIERFCFQHTKELLTPSGFYARRKDAGISEWIEFADYIPQYLHPDTQVALRVEMEKKRSQSDQEGYIYTFEIRDPNATSTIKLKVGRTVNLVKRMNQWSNQCESKEQVLRGWYPGSVNDDDNTSGGSFMKGRVMAGDERVWSHRLERLVHLELADLALNKAYLELGWRAFNKGSGKGKMQQSKIATNLTAASPQSPMKSKGFIANGIGNSGGKCADCGSVHKEIFEFQRVANGIYKGREWEGIVQKVIDEWGEFVKMYV